jgi:nitrite reductase (NADH) large subunit
MPRQIEAASSTMLQSKLEALGLKIHFSKATLHIGGEGYILEVDMLVISAGIRPRDELTKLAGLDVGMRGGIVVNDEMQTSDPCIFAIGECALHGGMIYGLVAPGYDMAVVVVSQLLRGARACTPSSSRFCTSAILTPTARILSASARR